MPSSFQGRIALVTGAAHGIGRSICVELSRRGATVWAADVLTADLNDTREACVAAGVSSGRCTNLHG